MSRFATLNAQAPVTLYHDGHCPFCRVEVAWLVKHRHQERVRLIDIQSNEFNASEIGRSFDAMMGQLHVQDNQGRWFIGMDASRAGPVCGVGLPAAGKTFLLTGPAKHDGCRLPFFCPTPYPAGAVVGKALG